MFVSRKVFIIVMILLLMMTLSVSAFQMSDISGHWAERNIQDLVDKGAINGYPDGTFRPNNTISKAEFCSVLSGALGLEEVIGAKTFDDVEGHWAKGRIEALVKKGVIDKNLYGLSYNPEKPITREEIAMMTVNMIGAETDDTILPFSDKEQIGLGYHSYVAKAYANNIIKGYSDGSFVPAGTATRAEAAVMTIRALGVIETMAEEIPETEEANLPEETNEIVIYDPEMIIEFEDANFEASIRAVYGLNDEKIRWKDIAYQKYLGLYGTDIETLIDLKWFNSLRNLDLYRCQINDISPLSGLTNLVYLGLHRNQISDIKPLAELTNLTNLSLGFNQISDISHLSGLTNLRMLLLDENQISDISPLSGLTNLTDLRLSDNQISDLSPLSRLTNLIFLGLQRNQISDISPLSGLTNLKLLWLVENQISDVDINNLKQKLPYTSIDKSDYIIFEGVS
ncbi:MAG: S-layer homology domain-containing protein [Dethiosulfatibacter sp.]|nr:S-layer homology domain-containing protein [Dethiosulfatibacter sp.]